MKSEYGYGDFYDIKSHKAYFQESLDKYQKVK